MSKGKTMQTYNSARELFLALLQGKKVRRKSWDKDSYHQFNGDNIVNHDNLLIDKFNFDGPWEEYLPPEERWDWEVGDFFVYRDNGFNTTYEVLFINESVLLGQVYEASINPERFERFYNNIDTIKAMRKI